MIKAKKENKTYNKELGRISQPFPSIDYDLTSFEMIENWPNIYVLNRNKTKEKT